MKQVQPSIIVPGGLNIDLIGLGVDRLLGEGEQTLGGILRIGPGGKARNMAQMAAAYLGPGRVAMIGRTSRDPFGLWRVPVRSLEAAGVDTSFIKILDFEESGRKYPGVALIPVDKKGKNQIYVLPGSNADFCVGDVDGAGSLFEGDGRRMMILALEIPMETAAHCIRKAARHGIPVVLDPGGISGPIDEILNERIFLLKPNEHEAKMLTGIPVVDGKSADQAARKLLSMGVQNVLLTCGGEGAYLFNSESSDHIPCHAVPETGACDETGCGDQVTAVAASCLAEGFSIEEAARSAVLAGTLQFHRAGIQPVAKEDLARWVNDGEQK
ncbi:MAG: ribokinase [Acidobacteria bacterium]|nr:ribokinase [Acidobacteriota bacterium]MBU1475676.1 ribokinase [Acidobacteriota bacterium]MBU4202617.1 ribokinase [Acidobacteriota bacterium]